MKTAIKFKVFKQLMATAGWKRKGYGDSVYWQKGDVRYFPNGLMCHAYYGKAEHHTHDWEKWLENGTTPLAILE